MNKPVLTGQQIGLLGGPLYTTYKVLGAIHYSKTIGSTPVYWLETNDADFNEINKIHFLDKDNRLNTLTWDIDSRGFSCGFIEVDDTLCDLFHSFFTAIKQTQYTEALQTIVADCYKKGITLGSASKKFAEKIFGWSGIELFDPSQDHFLTSIRPILEAEAENTESGNQCNFFCIDNKQRKAVFKERDGFYFRDGLKVDLEKYTLTPNVKTRSVCQDAYFETHTYIAGPGEIAYLSELDALYQRHNVHKAKVKKRMSVDLIEPRTNRLLRQCALNTDDIISAPKDMLVKKIIERETGTDYTEVKRSAHEEADRFIQQLGSLDLDTTGLNKILIQEIKTRIGKKRSGEKEALSGLLDKTRELSDRLLPFGKKQERIFNIMYYMNLYGGLDFIQWLYTHYDFTITLMEIRYD